MQIVLLPQTCGFVRPCHIIIKPNKSPRHPRRRRGLLKPSSARPEMMSVCVLFLCTAEMLTRKLSDISACSTFFFAETLYLYCMCTICCHYAQRAQQPAAKTTANKNMPASIKHSAKRMHIHNHILNPLHSCTHNNDDTAYKSRETGNVYFLAY